MSPPPRVRVDGSSYVYLLFAPEPIMMDESQRPQLDVKGLIWEPLATIRASKKGNIVVDF